MGGKYICQYSSNEGIVCENESTQPEGCNIHWKRRQQALCKQDGCVRPMTSKYEFCNLHVNKCHLKANYNRKKLDKMFQDWQTPEGLGEFLDRMKMPNAISWP